MPKEPWMKDKANSMTRKENGIRKTNPTHTLDWKDPIWIYQSVTGMWYKQKVLYNRSVLLKWTVKR